MRVAQLAAPPALIAQGKSPVSLFNQEAQRLVSLKHPYVLSLLEYGQQNHRGYLVMPYLGDGSLLDAFTPGKPTFRFALPLSAPTVVGLLDQVAEALQYLHGQGILHGSVKPSNMLVSPDASGGLHILLSDYGLANLFVSTPSRITRNHSVLYSAPELLQGRQVAASDQYSLGIVVYELLTGRLPFVGNDPAQIIQQQMMVPPPPPRNYNATLPPAVENVLFRALAKDPASRWPSVAAFAAAYREAATGQANAPQPQAQQGAILPAPTPPAAVAPVQQFVVSPGAPVAPAQQAPWPISPQSAPVSPPAPQASSGQGWNQPPSGWGSQYPANQAPPYPAYPAQPPAPIVPNSPSAPARGRGRLVGFGIGGVIALALVVVLVVVLFGGNKTTSTATNGSPTTPPGATATTPRATPGGQGTPSSGSTPGGSGGAQMIETDQFITAIATVTDISGNRQCDNTFPGRSEAEFQTGDTVLVVYTANLAQNQLQILVNIDKIDATTGESTGFYMPTPPQACPGIHTYVVSFATNDDPQKGPGKYKAEVFCLGCPATGINANATIFFQVQ
jgi:serine/threonine protein kinase